MPGSRKIALAVGGSIAAYKAVEVARQLIAEGIAITPVMTAAASHFLGPLTLAGICGKAVVRDMFDEAYSGEIHVEIARSVDLVLIVPATADLLARLASGRASDLVTALCLCAPGPVLAAPAMHARMWSHPATQRNLATLRADGRVKLIGPVEGPLASGESGMGRLADPVAIVAAVLQELQPRDLQGLRLVVTAGPTVEDIDPVRFLSNRSSGRMGFAVAERAAGRGAEVTLIAGPVELLTPAGVRRVDVRSALEMQAALDRAMGGELDGADALIMAAAVSDYAPRERHETKQKKSGPSLTLELAQNPDIIADMGRRRSGLLPVLVGFAVETADDAGLVAYARKKLEEKRLDLVVANHATDGFGGNTNRATFVSATAAEAHLPMTKTHLADRILDRVRALCCERGILPC